MFSYPLLQGKCGELIAYHFGYFRLSQKMAEDFFGNAQSAMSKTVRLDNRKDFIVTSVFENVGTNSSIKFDYLINWFSYLEDNPWAKEWGNNTPYTYVQLRTDANPELVDQKVRHLLEKVWIRMRKPKEHLHRNWLCKSLTRYTCTVILKKGR